MIFEIFCSYVQISHIFWQILELDPQNHQVMDELAELLIQMGEDVIAQQVVGGADLNLLIN